MTDSDTEYGSLRTLAAGVGLTIAGLLFSVGGGVIAVLLIGLLSLASDSSVAGILLFALVEVGYLACGLAYVARTDLTVVIEQPTREDVMTAAVGVVVAIATAAGGFAAIRATGLKLESTIATGQSGSVDPLAVVLLLLVMVVVAVSEEYLFRGVIQRRLELGIGDRAGLAVASVLFGLIHLGNYTGDPAAILMAIGILSLVGAIMGATYQRTVNLAVPAIVHYCYNATLVLLSVVGTTLF